MLIIFIILYITSLVLTYNWEFLPFDYLHPIPKPLLLLVINLISFSMTLFLKYNWPSALCQLPLHYMVLQYFYAFKMVIMLSLVTVAYHFSKEPKYWPNLERHRFIQSVLHNLIYLFWSIVIQKVFLQNILADHIFSHSLFSWYLWNDWLLQVYWLVSVHTWLCRHPPLLLSRFTCTWIIVYPGNPVFLGSYHVHLIIQKFIHEVSS